MKVIFLDFDGVLNSSASFLMESRRKKKLLPVKPRLAKQIKVNDTFSAVCASNFQYILDKCPDVKVVISSTWRVIHSMEYLLAKLEEYGIDSSRVIGKTPRAVGQGFSGAPRGDDISEWLAEHPEVTDYVILDDNSDMTVHMDKLVQTTWLDGLTLSIASTVIARLGGDATGRGLPL
jgi:hypothetical protein